MRSLYSSVILLNEIVQVLARPHLCALWQHFFSLLLTDRSVSRRVAIQHNALRRTLLLYRLDEKLPFLDKKDLRNKLLTCMQHYLTVNSL
jgi:predicted DNA-binding protein YlxM (UPF0122 family)